MSARAMIDLDTDLGKILTQCASASEKIVEVGSWHGEGSTLALSNGLIRSSQRMWVVEMDQSHWLDSSRFHKDGRIRFLNDRTVDVLDELPKKIDLLLLDGGDESTDEEFDLLYSRCSNFIILDDINDRKNRRQFAALKILKPLIRECHYDRNGWAIFGKMP